MARKKSTGLLPLTFVLSKKIGKRTVNRVKKMSKSTMKRVRFLMKATKRRLGKAPSQIDRKLSRSLRRFTSKRR